jgi:amylovoran biosynthesis glycosyltransferase AmsE
MTLEFSVLMVTYDGEDELRLERCLQSIESQTLLPKETVICLDGKIRESLLKVIEKYISRIFIKVIQNKKSTLAENLNIGLENCSYDFIVRCDSDDISLPNRFEEHINLLRNFDFDLVSANSIEIYKNKKRIKNIPHGLINKDLVYRYFRNPINHNVCAFRKESIKKYMYPTGRMEDFRLWTLLLNNNLKIYNQNKELLIADVNDLGSRRIGEDYRKAEIKLFLLNFKQNSFRSKFFALLAFILRYPLRFKISKIVLNYIYKLIRN